MNELILRIENVSKQYKLGQIGGTTLREEIQRLRARILHQEDPTRKIGKNDYQFGETFKALDDVSFDVKKGERVGIIGRNGAGKSTLLKLISRVTAPSSGKIGLNGRVASMLEVGTGFHGELTGRENIYMNGAILGMKKKEIDSKIEDIIEFSECRQFIDTPVKRYSSGMYVKLAFSVAAHLDAEIMIMDEVLAVGDMAFQKKCIEKMNDVSRTEGRTILYVSHNMNTIRQLCERCIVLKKGQLVIDGSVDAGIEKYLNANETQTTDIEVTSEMRSADCPDPKIRLNHIRLICENNTIERGSWAVVETVIESLSNEDRTFDVRLLIDAIDGSRIMMAVTNEKMLIQSHKTIKKRFKMDISNFVPGIYFLSAIIMEYGYRGDYTNIDVLKSVIKFKIRDEIFFNGIWKPSAWGSVFNGYLEEIT